MELLVLDRYVSTVKKMIGRDIWNRMCHVRKSSQRSRLVVIKYFSMYGQCLRICEDVSNFPKDWGWAMGMDLGVHGASYIIDA